MESPEKSKVTGSALVVGGGISGMQTALDLAESGFSVYLVEDSPSIGGVMARLDKTFPTNDCAMCILSPKLVEAGRHLNIHTFTNAEVLDISGTAGHFKAKILQRPRYIDTSKCTGCGDCEKACPVKVINEYEGGLNERKAVFRPFPQAYPNAFAIDKKARPLCQANCPAGVHAQGYVALIADGKFKEAVDLVRRDNPLPAICGRICTHPCEANCKRGLLDEPIAIAALKRFCADYDYGHNGIRATVPDTKRNEKIAIVGSGPAGLTCAYYLAQAGFEVVIYESLPVAGGMLAAGIPEYRLPKNILATEISVIQQMGVTIHTGKTLGKDFSLQDLKNQGFSAVFVAVGAHKEQKLGIPGEDLSGVLSGVEFLRKINIDGTQGVHIGDKVLIIGGGNVAMDAARSAIRLGAREVSVVYRRSREEMPASQEEVLDAEEEGVKFEFLASPTRVVGENGKVVGLECVRMKLGKPDESGRRRPLPIPGSEFILPADTIIAAIGQTPDLSWLEGAGNAGIEKTNRGTLKADPDTLQTAVEWIFAGGDAVTGPATAVEAVAAGKRAAESIIRFIEGKDLREGREFSQPTPVVGEVPWARERQPRVRMPRLPVEQRVKSFAEVELGYSPEDAVREAKRCLDCGVCSECLQCEAACRAKAIDHSMKPEIVELDVGAVVMSPGFDTFDPSGLPQYGYRKYPNVVTSVEFERILSASGPYEGHVVRPSDRKTPGKIAFIQCIGSRDEKQGCSYCSSVCCMYAIKEAIIAKEHVSQPLDVTIFFMDMRAYGKDFEKYYDRARNEYGIRFVRGKVAKVEGSDSEGNLKLTYTAEDGSISTEEFDMVVLSVGMRPSKKGVELFRKLGVHLDQHGYAVPDPSNPISTSIPGIFVSGAFASPKDIPETVMEASAAACAVGNILAPARWESVRQKVYPPEKDVRNQRPRIGVFICHCGINIGGVVNVPEVVEYAKGLPNVVYAESNLYTCSQDTQDKIKALIKEHNLNRVVVASCSPRTHEPLFQMTIREAGLNPYLFEMANIRDQCSWVHMHQPREATEKAKDLVRMAVAKARLLEPLYRTSVGVTQSALVIGGGVSGMSAAMSLAEQGFEVHLVERTPRLGGNLLNLRRTLEGQDVKELLQRLVNAVNTNPLIKVYLSTSVESVDGFVGNFSTTLKTPDGEVKVNHGVVIVATGGREIVPSEYGYGEHSQVITQTQLEQMISDKPESLQGIKDVVMIQCVGSRDEKHPYCSRNCCSQAIKNALALTEAYPHINVTILYRDVRTYGLKEDYYRKARDKGILFIRYEPEDKPRVSFGAGDPSSKTDKPVTVEVYDPVLKSRVNIGADLLVLSTGMEPQPDADNLAKALKVPLNQEGFFLEAHVKLRPVDFATEGVFVAGTAHAPKSITESIVQAQAAAGRAATVISKKTVEAGGAVASVNPNRCTGCGACESLCQFAAIRVDPVKKVATVENALCKGCGTCAATCRCGAVTLKGFTEEEILAEVMAFAAR